MCSGATELVLHKYSRPFGDKISARFFYHLPLADSWPHSKWQQVFKSMNHVVLCAFPHDLRQATLQGLAARHYYPHANRALCMESLKVLQVTVEERVFVVPLDF